MNLFDFEPHAWPLEFVECFGVDVIHLTLLKFLSSRVNAHRFRDRFSRESVLEACASPLGVTQSERRGTLISPSLQHQVEKHTASRTDRRRREEFNDKKLKRTVCISLSLEIDEHRHAKARGEEL